MAVKGHIKTYVATIPTPAVSSNLRALLFPQGSNGDEDDPGFCQIVLQADKGNTNDLFIGEAAKTISSTDYGFRLDPGDTSPNSFIVLQRAGAGLFRLSDFAVIGTAGEKVAITGVL